MWSIHSTNSFDHSCWGVAPFDTTRSWRTAYHLDFPRTRLEGIENHLQRVWSFLFKFYLKNHKYEGISAKKQEWSMQKWETKLNPEREKQAYHKLLYGCFCVCFLHILPCSHFCFLSLNPLNKEVHLSAFDRRWKMYYSFIIFSNPYVRWLTIHQRYELAPKFREQVIEAIKFSCTGTKGVNHSPIRTRPRCRNYKQLKELCTDTIHIPISPKDNSDTVILVKWGLAFILLIASVSYFRTNINCSSQN